MVIARVVDGHLHVVDRMRERVQLASGLTEDGSLSAAAEQRALECLARFGQRLAHTPTEHVRVVGTNTFRKARNRRAFLRRAEGALGHTIDVISGREEARVLFRGVAHDLPVLSGKRLVVDIGGGSTECILGAGEEPLRTDSMQMGCVAHSERYFPDGRITRDRFKRASLSARLELESVERLYKYPAFQEAVGSSGTILAVDAMAKLLPSAGAAYDGITLAAIKSLRDMMIAQGSAERLELPGLSAERRGVIAGGVAILHAVFKSFDVGVMRASKSALREGLLLELVGRLGDQDDRERTVTRLSERYAADAEQASRVEDMALGLARQVEDSFDFTARELRMLRWAARLHEIGQTLSFTGYHRHGAYLIGNSDMPGFSEQAQAYIAALIEAHRRQLSAERLLALRQIDGERAVRVAALLRLAVRLHRGRSPQLLAIPVLRVLDNKLELEFAPRFLETHAMTKADLEQERELLAPSGIALSYR
jgi:exopolyphosphatase/guanosine-5'-triphosphate,3'-diphosphate pyrophosphatase